MSGNLSAPNPSKALCLDLSRLISREGRGPWTGIDRVEAAYLNAFLNQPKPVFGLTRTSLGYVLLDRQGLSGLRERLLGNTPWGSPDTTSRLSRVLRRSSNSKRRVESDLRRLRLARCSKAGLARMLRRHLPAGTSWVNVGHTNLEARVFKAVKAVPASKACILIHDMIPLDYPEFQAPGMVETFTRRMKNVSRFADLVVYNSQQSQDDAKRYFGDWGRVPPGIIAHLGVEAPPADSIPAPSGPLKGKPYFVTTGTIEPRKNHAMLLDVWEKLTASDPNSAPHLVIIGQRGWNNDAVFKRLDTAPRGVTELNDLNDLDMAALTKGAIAALFPSVAEGFGLPPCEAVLLGTRPVVNDLPVYREILGNIPIYANAKDMYSWLKIITDLTADHEAGTSAHLGKEAYDTLPTWQNHFNQVLTVL
ncbi:MAG TPA: glycosyltransferase family 1 protein [Aliiroseovarius sp.]|nr:glycosyltransferase family 1 protein [Aliiroseovarius sp.]